MFRFFFGNHSPFTPQLVQKPFCFAYLLPSTYFCPLLHNLFLDPNPVPRHEPTPLFLTPFLVFLPEPMLPSLFLTPTRLPDMYRDTPSMKY